MAPARRVKDLIKTRREYVHVGSGAAAHGLVRPLPPLTGALQLLHSLSSGAFFTGRNLETGF